MDDKPRFTSPFKGTTEGAPSGVKSSAPSVATEARRAGALPGLVASRTRCGRDTKGGNIQKSMENQHFSWANQLFSWSFSTCEQCDLKLCCLMITGDVLLPFIHSGYFLEKSTNGNPEVNQPGFNGMIEGFEHCSNGLPPIACLFHGKSQVDD